jgi:hypothetical protein
MYIFRLVFLPKNCFYWTFVNFKKHAAITLIKNPLTNPLCLGGNFRITLVFLLCHWLFNMKVWLVNVNFKMASIQHMCPQPTLYAFFFLFNHDTTIIGRI